MKDETYNEIRKEIRTQRDAEILKLIDTTMYNVTNELMVQCAEPKDKDGVMLIMNELNKKLKKALRGEKWMKSQQQIIMLITEEGSARDEEHLCEVWNYRIKKYFPHYKLLSAKITG